LRDVFPERLLRPLPHAVHLLDTLEGRAVHHARGHEDDVLEVAGGGRGGEEDSEIGVLAEVLEGFFRPVRRGGEAVGAEPHPGEEGDERDVTEEMGILEVLGTAQYQPLDPLRPRRSRLWFGPRLWLFGQRLLAPHDVPRSKARAVHRGGAGFACDGRRP